MAEPIKHISLAIFMIAVVVLTVISLIAVWGSIGDDIIFKSFFTLVLIGAGSGITIIAARAVDTQGSAAPKRRVNKKQFDPYQQ